MSTTPLIALCESLEEIERAVDTLRGVAEIHSLVTVLELDDGVRVTISVQSGSDTQVRVHEKEA